MTDPTLMVALFLGLIEGLTEFIPVSSTGHLLLAGHFLGFESAGRTFEVVIQLGAVLAVLTVYSAKLVGLVRAAPRDPAAFRFLMAVLVAFLPAVVVGVAAHGIIKAVLFETPMLIAAMLILGGIVLLFVDRMAARPRYEDAMDVPLGTALKIGFIQCLAMIPGVSRSGATIVGALLMGADKRSAAEFSFFLAVPTMAGATLLDLLEMFGQDTTWATSHNITMLLVGCVVAFIVAILAMKWFVAFLTKYGFKAFGWYRIVVGAIILAMLLMGYDLNMVG